MVVRKRKIAFYGGSFDPVHCGHLLIAAKLLELFDLGEFVFVPAFHAPHKPHRKPTSGYHRYAMLCIATNDQEGLKVSRIELEMPDRPYSVETLARLAEEFPDDELYFVMGADSWQDIRTWREWEKVLLMTNHIVVTRPGFDISLTHVSPAVQERVIDLRGRQMPGPDKGHGLKIYITDAVRLDISASEIRRRIREKASDWRSGLDKEVAKYIEKYQIYS